MSEHVRELWQRLESWAQAEAPAMRELLRAPASPADLARLERETGLTLPADFRAGLLVHDGEEDGDYLRVWRDGGRLLTAAEIREQWLHHRQFAEDPEKSDDDEDSGHSVVGPVRAAAFREGWIPFMDMNGDVTWYVDLDPAPGGQRGQVIEVDLECGSWSVLAPSYEAFLRGYVEALEAGEFDARDLSGLPERSTDREDDGGFSPEEEEEYLQLYEQLVPGVVRSFAGFVTRKKAHGLDMRQLMTLSRLGRALPWQKLVALAAGTRTEVVGLVHESSGELHRIVVTGGYIQARGAIDARREPPVFRFQLEIGAGGPDAVHAILAAEPVDLDAD